MDRQGGFLITRIKQVSGRLFQRILARRQINAFNGPQGRILYVLWQQDGIPISDLARETGLAVTTLTSMLDRMEGLGLVLRDRGDTDRRKMLICLTEKARGWKDEYDAVAQEMGDIFYKGFTEEEIRACEGYLGRILKNVEEGS